MICYASAMVRKAVYPLMSVLTDSLSLSKSISIISTVIRVIISLQFEFDQLNMTTIRNLIISWSLHLLKSSFSLSTLLS